VKRISARARRLQAAWRFFLENAGYCTPPVRERWLGYIAGTNGPNGGGVKTYSYDVQGNYGQGFETVCSEDSRKEALVRLREYRENEPEYPHRIVRVTT
jgi:hypothetical protein